MTGIVIGWKQTETERYDTGVNETARGLIERIGPIIESEGGCHLDPDIELPGEEYVLIEGDVDLALLVRLRDHLSAILGNPETLTIETEGKAGVNIA